MHSGKGLNEKDNNLNEIVRKIQEIQTNASLMNEIWQAFTNLRLDSDHFELAVFKLREYISSLVPSEQDDEAAQNIYNKAIDIGVGEILLNLNVAHQRERVSLRSIAMAMDYHVAEMCSREKFKWDMLHDYVTPAIQKRIEDKMDVLRELKESLDENAGQHIEYRKNVIYAKIRELKLIADFQILGKGRGYFTLLASALNKIGITKELVFHADVFNAGIRDITLDIRTQMLRQKPNIQVLNDLLMNLEAHIRENHQSKSDEDIASLVIAALKDTPVWKKLSIYDFAQRWYAETKFWQKIQAIEEKITPKNQEHELEGGNLGDEEAFNNQSTERNESQKIDPNLSGKLKYFDITNNKPMMGFAESRQSGMAIIVNIIIILATVSMITATLADEAGFGTMAHGIFSDFSEEKAEKATSGIEAAVGAVALVAWNLWSYKSRSAASAVRPVSSS